MSEDQPPPSPNFHKPFFIFCVISEMIAVLFYINSRITEDLGETISEVSVGEKDGVQAASS